ncbi:YggS family pyridoxal phosphate-dependent enzyme [Gryllotalpicola reticulitermitis]|uniref:Pyridoxal phosphate homeostasis protein n=1 Tax=Gryllotalpicola reticulitermitis TaxID=1184153 RepID=A0ABV8QA15_9MICO
MPGLADRLPELADRLAAVRAEIADAARAAGRDPGALTTIVVTKFHPATLIRELYGLGVRDVGENRHQEALAKSAELAELEGLRWHFIGQLQSNKARQVRRYSHIVHSVDRPALVDALATRAGEPTAAENTVDIFLQLNLTDDPGRGGVAPAGLEALAEHALAAPGLRLRGVMAVAPLGEDPRAAFERLRAASDRLRALAPDARDISAGMSADFRAAVLEGATHLRIGTAITGSRPAPR